MTDDSCPDIVEDWHGKAATPANPYHDATIQAAIDARLAVQRAMSALRYGGGINMRNSEDFTTNATETDFLTAITEWLEALNRKLSIISDTTTDMAAELQDLRSQRKAIRDFLGLNTTERNT